ncbi:MAG: aminotransferase class IV [Rhodospirillaceae bacterium]
MSQDADYGKSGMGWAGGAYRPVGELAIPVTDMGFQLSDMCYDAVHVRNGKFFRLTDHLDRFDHSLNVRRYDRFEDSSGNLGPLTRVRVHEILNGCVARAGLKDSMITFLATRGTPAGARKDLRTATNRFMAWAVPYHGITTDEEMAGGCDLIIPETIRIPHAAVDPTVKNFGRLDFVRALYEAYDRGGDYALLLDTDGYLTEGRGWNIFVLKDGRLLSPDRGVLEGVTRKTVIEIAAKMNIEASLARITPDDIKSADEAFLSSTAGGVMPVRSVDGQSIGAGDAPGPVTQRMTDLYWALHDDPAYATPVDYAAGDAAAAE